MERREAFYIGGEWVAPASERTIEIVSPWTETVVAEVPEANEADVDRAVAAARAAFDGGALDVGASQRADWLAAIAAGIRDRADEIASLITLEMGSPALFSNLGQVLPCHVTFDQFADLARGYAFEEERAGMLGKVLVRKVPVGVSAAIIAWNVPLFLASMKVGAALAAGSPVVLKPAPEAPLSLFVLAEICDAAGVPAGALNVVPAGREVGEYLVRHPGVDKVSFTGSTAAGRKVAAICGEQLKRCTLELGGKSAAIVLDDADLEAAVPLMLPNSTMNTGQACLAQTRILAPRSRYDEVVAAVTAGVEGMAVGDPSDMATVVGPLVAERQRKRVEGYLEVGREEGAVVATGGGRPAGLDHGWFVEPTVLRDVDNSMRVAREEIFGPVVVVIPYEDDDDAVRIANDSDYGLSGSVWTTDTERGVAVAERIRTGTVGVNAIGTLDFGSPFGGFKASGIGRELGPEGLEEYLEYQSIIVGA